jgi:hypothetical protein
MMLHRVKHCECAGAAAACGVTVWSLEYFGEYWMSTRRTGPGTGGKRVPGIEAAALYRGAP